MCAVWALLLGAAYYLVRRYRAGALMVAALVMSHWVLDFVTHRPDLPLYPGGTVRAGLGLWNSVPATLVVEGAMFVAGLWLYLTATRARDRTGVVALWATGASSCSPPISARRSGHRHRAWRPSRGRDSLAG